MLTVIGTPPVSFLPRHETRNQSRTIFVSHLSADEPLTVTSPTRFHSSSEGTGLCAPAGIAIPLGLVEGALAAVFALFSGGSLSSVSFLSHARSPTSTQNPTNGRARMMGVFH